MLGCHPRCSGFDSRHLLTEGFGINGDRIREMDIITKQGIELADGSLSPAKMAHRIFRIAYSPRSSSGYVLLSKVWSHRWHRGANYATATANSPLRRDGYRTCRTYLLKGEGTSGFYAYSTPENLQKDMRTQHPTDATYWAAGAVMLWGAVVTAEWGFRAERAKIESIILPSEIRCPSCHCLLSKVGISRWGVLHRNHCVKPSPVQRGIVPEEVRQGLADYYKVPVHYDDKKIYFNWE